MATITIPSGATLSGLARQYETTTEELMKLNPQIKDPNLIYAGASLNIPTPSGQQIPVQFGKSGKAFFAPNVPTAEKVATIQSEIAKIQSEIQKRQAALTEAGAMGITTGEIPAEVLEKHGLIEAPTTPPSKTFDEAIDDVLTGTAGVEDLIKAWIKQQEEQTKLQQKTQKGYLEKMEEWFKARPTSTKLEEEARQRFLERYGLPADWEKQQMQQFLSLQQEMVAGRQKLIDIETREQQALMGAEQRMAPMTFIRGEQALIQRQYAIEKIAVAQPLSAKAAEAELLRGNVQMADRYIKDYMELASYEYKQQKEEIEWFMDYYKDYYDTLDKKTKESLGLVLQLAERKEELAKEEAEEKWELVKQGAGAGLDWTDLLRMPLEEARNEFAKRVAAIPPPDTAPEVKLTSGQLTQMAERGLPRDVAQDIHQYSLMGYDWDTIYASMRDTFGAVNAGRYIDIYRDVIKATGVMRITSTPEIEIVEKYEERAKKEEAEAEQRRIEVEKKGVEFKWYDIPTLGIRHWWPF